MDVEVADEAAGGTEDSPPTAAGWVVLIMSFPRELRAGGAVAGAVADIEEALQRAEGDLAVGRAFEGQMRLLDEIEEVVVPDIHLDDAPASGKRLGEGGNPGHQPGSASSLGSRTRL